MALAMLAEIPDLTREEYERVVRKVNESGSPAGAVFHAGGPIEGGYRVIEVWESREAADAFYGSEQYKEATATTPTQPRILMTWAISGVDRGSGWQPADREGRDRQTSYGDAMAGAVAVPGLRAGQSGADCR